jgi:hypothetical protein
MCCADVHNFMCVRERFGWTLWQRITASFRPVQAYYILDELLIAGEHQETSKKTILKVTAAQDAYAPVAPCAAQRYATYVALEIAPLRLASLSTCWLCLACEPRFKCDSSLWIPRRQGNVPAWCAVVCSICESSGDGKKET